MAQARARSSVRLPLLFLVLLVLVAAVTITATLIPQSMRHFLQSVFCDAIGRLRAAGLIRILMISFAAWNFKVLPGVYHLRIALAILPPLLQNQHQHAPPKAQRQPPACPASSSLASSDLPLFAPHTLSTFCPPLEHDSNLHKSNSTYFSDLDISRSALLARLFLPTLRHMGKPARGGGANGVKLTVALGGAQADFKRGIALQRYRVVSRVVGWDRKWVVVGSWFVSAGGSKKKETTPTVYASALAKYVFKAGRATIRPVIVMVAAGLLPLAALDDGLDDVGSEKGQGGSLSVKEAEVVGALKTIGRMNSRNLEVSDNDGDVEGRIDDGEWMRRVEEVRQEGMVVTERFLGLDALANLA